MPMDDNIADLASSEQITDVAENPDTSAVESDAAPSAAQDEEPTMLSVVRDVVAEDGDAGSSPDKENIDDPAQAGADVPKDPDDTNFSDVPFHKHPRFQQLLTKSKANEADATRYRKIEGFLGANDISAEEAADAWQLAALVKSDPKTALEKLRPIVRELLEATGEVLPEDLQTQVVKGQMPRTAALEVSRARAQVQQVAEARARETTRAQQEQAQRLQTDIRGAASAWVGERAARDPQYAAKEPDLAREIAFLQRSEGRPNTPDGVRDQLNRAYAEVNKRIRPQATPQNKPPVRPMTGGGAGGNQRPEPKSMLDALR